MSAGVFTCGGASLNRRSCTERKPPSPLIPGDREYDSDHAPVVLAANISIQPRERARVCVAAHTPHQKTGRPHVCVCLCWWQLVRAGAVRAPGSPGAGGLAGPFEDGPGPGIYKRTRTAAIRCRLSRPFETGQSHSWERSAVVLARSGFSPFFAKLSDRSDPRSVRFAGGFSFAVKFWFLVDLEEVVEKFFFPFWFSPSHRRPYGASTSSSSRKNRSTHTMALHPFPNPFRFARHLPIIHKSNN